MKIIKKIAALLAILLLVFGLVGCSGSVKDDISTFNDTVSSIDNIAENVIDGTVHYAADKLQGDSDTEDGSETTYHFRNEELLKQHYQKHGVEMGFASEEEYEKAASAVITNPESLSKTEEEDGDYCYYLESANEFAILSTDGYIRTYFNPSAGKAYFDKQ